MFTDRNALIEYAYNGTFYRNEDVTNPDGDLIGGDQTQREVVILEVDCDIQDSKKVFQSNVIKKEYTVYFPLQRDMTLPEDFKEGIYFRSEMYGKKISGMVFHIQPTQIGGFNGERGMEVDIQGTDV